MAMENIYSAKTHLSGLIEKALKGEEVVIAKAGKPLVRIVPYEPAPEPMTYGLLKGKVKIAKDFDEYSEEVTELFRGYEPGDS